MKIAFDLQALVELQRAFERAPQLVAEEMLRAMAEADLLLQREAQELTPVGVGGGGGLRGSITRREEPLSGGRILGVVGSPLSYAAAVELGTRPHMPPIEPLIDWVRQKLPAGQRVSIKTRRSTITKEGAGEAERIARAIQWKIAHYGTPAVGMFHRALAANRAQIARIFGAARERIAQRLGGAV